MNYDEIYPKFTIMGYYKNILVVDVYDGDTITVLLNPYPDSQYSDTYSFKVRLLGIDSEEIRQGQHENREKLKKLAYESKEYLSQLILYKFVDLDIKSIDNFGRLLAYVLLYNGYNSLGEYNKLNNNENIKHTVNFMDDNMIDINQQMLDSGHAKKYTK